MKKTRLFLCLTAIILLFCSSANAAKGQKAIKHTKHNMSISGPGSVRVSSEQEVCKFCHTPHMTGMAQLPRWQSAGTMIYVTYKSSTLKASVGQPNGTSRLCLACHDGTVALGMATGKTFKKAIGGLQKMPTGHSNLGYDLSDDHPLSFVFSNTLASRNGQLEYP